MRWKEIHSCAVFVLCGWLLAAAAGQTGESHPMTAVEFDHLMQDLSNWGRWGKTDQLGTLNLITSAKMKQAAALVSEGHAVSLARNTDTHTTPDNQNPFKHEMKVGVDGEFNMDDHSIFFHGFGHTHFDALSHAYYKGQMYNGFPQSAAKSTGMEALAVTADKNGIFTRGVLIDIAWLRNVPYLDTNALIYPEDLDAWEKKTGTHIESGDAVFVRTGRWARRAKTGPWDIGSASAGLHASCARWFHQRNIALLGGDTANDAIPSRIPGVNFPLHQLLLVAMGTPMLDQCDLEDLAAAVVARHRQTFLLTVAPLRVTGGTGSLVNPVAMF
jgi:kynurenine formamidase